jgi:hypothetical protein
MSRTTNSSEIDVEPAAIKMPPRATIGNVEYAVDDFYSNFGHEAEALCLDFSESTFIEVATLQFVTAFIIERERRRLSTRIRLPAGEPGLRARHFLRRWNYDSALRLASGKLFKDVVDARDHIYFAGSSTGGDPGDPYAGAFAKHDTKNGEVVFNVEAYRFFGFRTWRLEEYGDKAVIFARERALWASVDQVVTETLRRRLRKPEPIAFGTSTGESPDPPQYLLSRIVFEAMTNAVRHPRANLIQASSHLDGDQFFTLVYWDDGVGMHRTLGYALDQGYEIASMTDIRVSYLVLPENEPGKPRTFKIVSSLDLPNKGASDEDLLVACLFPGTSCDVAGATYIANPTVGDHRLARPGHGLYVLAQAAIDNFGGSLAFRTENLFMTVSALSEKEWRSYASSDQPKPGYRVTIKKRSDSVPCFLGNMITIRLPMQRRPNG